MSFSDPLGDMLTRIRNGQKARMDVVACPDSKLRRSVLDVLKREGYIRGYTQKKDERGIAQLMIELKYDAGQAVIQMVQRVSKPGRRVYSGSKTLPRVANGLGVVVISTPNGVMADYEAREQNVGGEVLCQVF
ncbi:MAG: 30S ribosomal protein S8 [Micavibrio aeruginosavorus]|nr:30S ribosomal protein S8 [Micavibrio aeruginosavorus]